MKKLILLFTAIWTVLLLTPSVHAADIRLSSRCTLADAIIVANNDRAEGDCPAGRGADTITLSQDITLDGSLPKITSDITIEGNDYTISGDNRYRIFFNEGGALTIHDLTMTKGYYVEGDLAGGGAIVNWQGTLTISDSIFSHNSADAGGAIANRKGTLSISDSAFSHNSAAGLGWGGAIVNWVNGELSISDSSFSRNSADTGGAIFNVGGELSISDSTFSGNSADREGGAIANWEDDSKLSIVNSSFSRNSAVKSGAIANAGELSISDSAFSHNSADDGGAILSRGELNIGSSAFSHNSADEVGGAIYNYFDGELSISDSIFSDNSADAGGAIANLEELSMVNSIIAGGDGNACYSSSRLRHNINNFIQDGSCSPAWRD